MRSEVMGKGIVGEEACIHGWVCLSDESVTSAPVLETLEMEADSLCNRQESDKS